MDIKFLTKYMISGLLDFNNAYDAVCAENKELSAENKALKEKIEFITKKSKRSPFNNVEKVALKNGENELFDDCIYGIHDWNKLKIKYNESENAFECTSYQTWLKNIVFKDNLPETINYNDFVTHFNKRLYKMYEEEKAKRIEELKKNMKKVEEIKENE
jgi:hypothetical protein